jgi:predicted alpha/beta hydrolase family esterase
VKVLILPGWHDSGPQHWQSEWVRLHGDRRVEQDDWVWPKRGDWMARLDEVLLTEPAPVALVAHSLGCQLVAAWAAHTRHAARVGAAMLVAPPDTERPDTLPNVASWRPIVRRRLPFASLVVASSDDLHCELDRARGLAGDWGSEFVDKGPRGHLNADSGLGAWAEGRDLLARLVARAGVG